MNTRHMRPFAYFSGEGKVGRVWAGEAQDLRSPGRSPRMYYIE